MPGFAIESDCPKCGQNYHQDLANEYLSHPPINEPFDFVFECFHENDDGETCGQEWTAKVILRVSFEVVTPWRT